MAAAGAAEKAAAAVRSVGHRPSTAVAVARSGRVDCTFCRLIQEDSARWVAHTPRTCAFSPLDPLAPGHTLVVPTQHYADVFDTPHDVLAATMELVKRVAGAMRTALDASGVNILSASGPGSEQSVPHLHFHVVPRWVDDGISTWPSGRSEHRTAGDPGARLAELLAEGRRRGS
ncbi:HIT domain-containing protein [Streptomyces flaveolus]|uniref:HIT family protein n=1 Tax=Streptomyces flaveolus TaxID=67297 RepID=UPI003334612A